MKFLLNSVEKIVEVNLCIFFIADNKPKQFRSIIFKKS